MEEEERIVPNEFLQAFDAPFWHPLNLSVGLVQKLSTSFVDTAKVFGHSLDTLYNFTAWLWPAISKNLGSARERWNAKGAERSAMALLSGFGAEKDMGGSDAID